jgi:hypothetical protein
MYPQIKINNTILKYYFGKGFIIPFFLTNSING